MMCADWAMLMMTCRECGRVEYMTAKGVDALADLSESVPSLRHDEGGALSYVCEGCAPAGEEGAAA